jgi:transcriptional regulator with PAS, ATPase and Fis domain
VETPAPVRDNVGVTATTQQRPAVVERIILRTRGTLTERDPLVALDELQALRAELDAYEHELVRRALASGGTFAAVARSLGISRQAAHRRYRDEFGSPNGSFPK